MKTILSALTLVLELLVALLAIVILIPVAFIIHLIFGFIDLYKRLWKTLRHDPKVKLDIKELADYRWEVSETTEGFVAEFEELLDGITLISSAKQGATEYTGFETLSSLRENKWSTLTLEKTLHTKHAEVRFGFDFEVKKPKGIDKLVFDLFNDADQHSPFLPVTAVVVRPQLHTKRVFYVSCIEDIWMIASFLRGNTKFTNSGQLWAYIPEHKVWLVQYKTNMRYYGLRNSFTGTNALEYNYDK